MSYGELYRIKVNDKWLFDFNKLTFTEQEELSEKHYYDTAISLRDSLINKGFSAQLIEVMPRLI